MKKMIDRLIVGVFKLIKTCWNLQKSEFFSKYYALDRLIFQFERIDNFHLVGKDLSDVKIAQRISKNLSYLTSKWTSSQVYNFFPDIRTMLEQNQNEPNQLEFSMQSIITLDGLSD